MFWGVAGRSNEEEVKIRQWRSVVRWRRRTGKEILKVTIKKIKKVGAAGTGELAQWVKACPARVLWLEPTWWEERTNSRRLSSDLPTLITQANKQLGNCKNTTKKSRGLRVIDSKEAVLCRPNRAGAHMNPQRLRQHAQLLHRFQPSGAATLRAPSGHGAPPQPRSYLQPIPTGKGEARFYSFQLLLYAFISFTCVDGTRGEVRG